ncbi:hypothetical protein F5X68DRAFT_241186 [Plectosphaerella plurivora]|uniref:BZIP transcription factor n=1 Tax=Plectosphaerella plurivora TaxID=936078 RepID=A0A9P9A9J0_9PEZI|nr:hypothetical protein F5X68DRAFT_241186 [Plectosphaerella plurivora]
MPLPAVPAVPSSSGSPPRKPGQRVHSDAQLVRKRQMDRLKQKTNRDENKKRMEKLEGDMALLLSKVDGMARQLDLHLGSVPRSPSPLPMSPSTAEGNAHVKLEETGPETAAMGGRVSFGDNDNYFPPANLAAHCRCGIQHLNLTECLEYSSLAMLYEAHVGIAQDPERVPPRLPLNPPVANMILLSTEGNPVVFFASTILRQFVVSDIQTLLGIYLVAYRFLRWRLYPDATSLEGVPEWLRPTAVQEAHVHPLCIDYIPWPALRDYLCLNQDHDRRHSVALYIRSLRLAWPSERPLLQTDLTNGGVILDPAFPDFATDILNWNMGSPWEDEFPQLTGFLRS